MICSECNNYFNIGEGGVYQEYNGKIISVTCNPCNTDSREGFGGKQ